QGLTVRVETDADVPLMEIDRGLLRQAVLNLVKNGLEALSRGGELTLTSRRDGDAVELSVADSGGGIPDDIGRRLFEPFFTTKPQGTGLGLSITRQIPRSTAARSGGRAGRAAARASRSGCRSRGRMAEPANILVADDDPGL